MRNPEWRRVARVKVKALVIESEAALGARWPELAAMGQPFVAQRYVAGSESETGSYHVYADELPGLVMAHSALADPERYIRRADQAEAGLDELAAANPDARLLALGHTHRAWLYCHGTGDQRGPRLALKPGQRYLVNPGAVRQSRYRERRPLARFALLDLPDDGGEGSVELFTVEYDDATARSALRAHGWPADNVHLRPSVLSGVKRRVRAAFR